MLDLSISIVCYISEGNNVLLHHYIYFTAIATSNFSIFNILYLKHINSSYVGVDLGVDGRDMLLDCPYQQFYRTQTI